MTGSRITSELISKRLAIAKSEAKTWAVRVPQQVLHDELERLLSIGRDGESMWMFAYGALLWGNALGGEDWRIARVHGLHRRFCLWQWAYRGTLDNPCLMLALDHGGSCEGAVYRLRDRDLHTRLWKTFCAEMDGGGYRAVWVNARTAKGTVRALTFVIDRTGERYAGHLSIETVADRIAFGCGTDGACADYLRRTVDALHRGGIKDRYLCRLDQMVAHRLNVGGVVHRT